MDSPQAGWQLSRLDDDFRRLDDILAPVDRFDDFDPDPPIHKCTNFPCFLRRHKYRRTPYMHGHKDVVILIGLFTMY